MQSKKKKVSEVCSLFKMIPQKMVNIKFDPALRHKNLLANPMLKKIMVKATKEIGSKGRLLIRQSGTEPLIRVMVESNDASFMTSFLEKLAKDIKQIVN